MLLDLQPLILSLKVALCALALVVVLGTLAARLMTARSFWGQSLLDGLFLLPLVLPPVVTGYVLLMLLGKRGAVGAFLYQKLQWEILFTPTAAVLAAAVVAFPLMYGSMKAAFLSYDLQLEEAASTLGAAPNRVFWSITLPLCLPGLVAGTLLAFARALGEFGATVMVAGNIPGDTQTLPLLLYERTLSGDDASAIWAAVLLCAATVPVGILLVCLTKSRGRGG